MTPLIPKQHMLTHLVVSVRKYGSPKSTDTGPFEHKHTSLLKKPFGWSAREERPELLVELTFNALHGTLGRTGELATSPLAPIVASTEDEQVGDSETDAPALASLHGKFQGHPCSVEDAFDRLREVKDAVRTRSNPSPSPPTLKAWIVQAAQAFLDPTAPAWNSEEVPVRVYWCYRQYTEWSGGRARGGFEMNAPVFVAIKGGEGHAANSLHESGRSDHPFSATLDHDVWMGQATAFVQVKEF